MRRWLKDKLIDVLRRFEQPPRPAEAQRSEVESELAYLSGVLERLEEECAGLEEMLALSQDSFHHALASSTTTHADALRDRRDAVKARIATLESRAGYHAS